LSRLRHGIVAPSGMYTSIACNLDTAILQTALPLFESERVQGLEWSFDALYDRSHVPDWFEELLHVFAAEGRLVGHGVFYSLFSGQWRPEQATWLDHLRRVARHYRFDHVTEHFGFMTGANFHQGAPMSVPYNAATLALGQDRLARISEAAQCPVGLENLAYAYTLREVEQHGEFLARLIAPVNGFIILDLHNLYCQMHNFEVDFADIIQLYPLERVREVHISGGSWQTTNSEPGRTIRRDTHDDAVPTAVFELLEKVMPLCPNLKFVVLEQLGTALDTAAAQEQYQRDFYTLDRLVQQQSSRAPYLDFLAPPHLNMASHPLTDAHLAEQQLVLSRILEQALSIPDAQAQLNNSVLANSDWRVENWSPAMLETAMAIAQKWK
jgi:uncharacterized protein